MLPSASWRSLRLSRRSAAATPGTCREVGWCALPHGAYRHGVRDSRRQIARMRAGGGSLVIHTADYHTAGEPFRIVSGGVPALAGETVLDRRAFARDHLDHVRAFLVNEPRGHADMYGCFVTPPTGPESDLGVLFFHNAGFSTACGHGTIALATAALETGMLRATAPETRLVIDAPSGALPVVASVEDGRVHRAG